MEYSLNSQENKNQELKKELQKQFEDFESRINSKIYINNDDCDKDECICREKNIVISGVYSNNERNSSDISEINKNNNKLLTKFYNMKKVPLYKEDEECDIFITFNLKNNDPMLVWTIKRRANIIYAFNMRNSVRFPNSTNVHQNKIDRLKYFYNDNDDIEKKEFIISFSEKDNYLTVWKINNDYYNPSLEFFKKITKSEVEINISIFCMFSNKNYSNKDNYIFIYDKKNINQKGIYYYKIDNGFNIIPNEENNNIFSLILDINNINYLDTYYDVINGKLYLLNCNQINIIVYENPIGKNLNKIIFRARRSSSHLYGCIIKRKNNLELFESNYDGIYVWDIYNNNNPKFEVLLNGNNPFYINIWNDNDYFWVASDSGPKLFEINSDKIIERYEKKDCSRKSKIMKIIIDDNESIVGVDNEQKLCVWNNIGC